MKLYGRDGYHESIGYKCGGSQLMADRLLPIDAGRDGDAAHRQMPPETPPPHRITRSLDSLAVSVNQPASYRRYHPKESTLLMEAYRTMWRAFFLAVGAYCCLLGVEALALEQAVLKPESRGGRQVAAGKVISPPDWAPWSLMGAGAVVVLYSFSIPRRVGSGG